MATLLMGNNKEKTKDK